jgi:iron complex outermembrane receptor protein/outer membrane receptor for ferrienterochelin and colicins
LFCNILLIVAVVIVSSNTFAETELPYMDIGEIVVYGEKKPENPVVVVNKITEKDLKEMGVQTVAEALEFVPGIDVQNVRKGEWHLSIRGFNQNEIKVLIDGVPAYEGYFGTVDLGAIPIESIEKIVVTKGASSVLYGANTMGGVVNIITKKGKRTPETKISTSLGNYNTQNYIFSHRGQHKKFNYYLGASRRISDALRLSDEFNKTDKWMGADSEYREDGGKRELSDYKKHSVTANIEYKPDENFKTNLSFSWFNQAKGCPISLNRYWRFSEWNQWQTSFALDKRFSSDIRLKTRFFYVEHTDELTDEADKTVASGGKSWFDKSIYDDFSTGGEIHFHLILARWNLMRFGVSYQKDQHNENEYNAKNKKGTVIVSGWGNEQTYEADTYCIGVEDSLMCTHKFSFILGCSYNGYVPVKSADMPGPGKIQILTPQAGVAYDIAENTTIFSSVGRKIRFPRMKELYSEHAGGNPDLEAEQTIASEIGIKQKIAVVEMYVSGFNNNITNLIEQTKDSSGNWMYLNIGAAQVYGVETGADVRISDALNITGNYTYLHTWNKTDHCQIAQKPKHKFNLNTNYSFPFGLSVNLQGVYVGEQKVYYNKGKDVRTAQDYILLNIKLTQKLTTIKFSTLELFISVNNITDKNYEEGNGPMPGRNTFAGINFKF